MPQRERPLMWLGAMAAVTAVILAIYSVGIAYARRNRHDLNVPSFVRWPFAICVTIFLYVMVVIVAPTDRPGLATSQTMNYGFTGCRT
jgi:succinate dehydrogenase hydrophobic anchor subunit